MEDLHPSDPAVVGRYRVVARIGTGGMGVVYLAETPAGARVALKLVRSDLAADPAFRSRFQAEVHAGQKVGGFYAARYLDADLFGDHPYLVTEYVEGDNLFDYVTGHGPLEGDQLVGLAVGLAEALVALRSADVIHLDLKPSNVVMAATGPKVVDFGISNGADNGTALAHRRTVMGSPGWMAPEQAAGCGETAAMDVFSWGATIAFAGTGRSPFGSGHRDAILYRVAQQAPDLVGLDPRLNPIVSQALEKYPALRPNADQLLLTLIKTTAPGAVLRGAPVALTTAVRVRSGQWPAPPDRFVEPSHRTRSVWLSVAVLIVVASLVGLGFAFSRRSNSSNNAGAPTSTDALGTSTSVPHTTTTATTTDAPASPLPATTVPNADSSSFDYSAAVHTIENLGYTVLASQGDEAQAGGPLYVLTATCTDSADGFCQNAFFFIDNRYIGTDISGKDEGVSVSWQHADTVALTYPLYVTEDPPCCPTGGVRTVRFHWDGSFLRPLDELPVNPNSVSSQ